MSDIITPELLAIVSAQIDSKLTEYKSLERWPTCGLLPSQFPTCACGCSRTSHRMVGTQRLRCSKRGCNCSGFSATVFDATDEQE